MKYFLVLALSILFFLKVSHCQKPLDVTVILTDTSVNIKKVRIEYFDGKFNIPITDSFKNNVSKITGSFYSEFAPFTIYFTVGNDDYNKVFFIGNKPAKIYVSLCQKNCNEPLNFICFNATLITDTATNSTYRELFKRRINASKPITELWEKYSADKIFSNDSLKNLHNLYFKELNNQTMQFLKEHSSKYFSLWYFRTQVVIPSLGLFRDDTAYLKSLLTFFVNVFPKKYQQNFEGKKIRQSLEEGIHPITLNNPAPSFSKNDIAGKKIALTNLKGKYVLLDFWASWCSPCLASMPLLKELKQKYSEDKFILIGINSDPNISILKKTISAKQMNWVHLFDSDNSIFGKFGVYKIPAFFLIDPNGIIIFRGVGLNDKQKVSDLLERLMK
ncbi:MAG: redoxin domain-containing protein [Chitinophagaceae bacterium]|nr:redoxin domain-containing protein [Chitinophagaceae bacterium]